MSTPQTVKAILFDLNDTLVRQNRSNASHIAYTYAAFATFQWAITFEAFSQAWNSVLARANQTVQEGIALLRTNPRHPDARSRLYDPWFKQHLASILRELTFPANSDLVELLSARFQESWLNGLTLTSADIPPALRQLRERGYRLGLVSNFQLPSIVPDILDRFELRHFFEVVIISAEVQCRKPHPTIFKAALEKLNEKSETHTAPVAVVMVGDSLEEDIAGARYSNFTPVLFDPGGLHPTFPGYRIANFSELPSLLEGVTVSLNTEGSSTDEHAKVDGSIEDTLVGKRAE